MTPEEAYYKAVDEGYSEELEDICCQDPCLAYWFARDVSKANILECMKYACLSSDYALDFALDIPGADILYCAKSIIKNEHWAEYFINSQPQYVQLLRQIPEWQDFFTKQLIKNIIT